VNYEKNIKQIIANNESAAAFERTRPFTRARCVISCRENERHQAKCHEQYQGILAKFHYPFGPVAEGDQFPQVGIGCWFGFHNFFLNPRNTAPRGLFMWY
jgi:hypothetical protein